VLFLFAVLAAVALYFLILGLLWMQQERIVFQPPIVLRALFSPPAIGERVRQVSYRAEDGTGLFAFLVGRPDHAKQVLVAFHGNADLARNLIPWAEAATRAADVAVLLPEIRGYDGLSGRPTYFDAARDARAALNFVVADLGVRADRVAYFGHSLGSAIAAELASETPPTVLILQSPFSSARAMAQRMVFPGINYFWPLVSRVHYDTVRLVRDLAVPVWVAHGLRDRVVPVAMGKEVYEAAMVKGDLLLVPGAGHNDVAEKASTEYWNWLRSALSAR